MKKQILFLALGLTPLFSQAATYEVPVEDALKKYASFAIPAPQVVEYDKTAEISYHLPPELVGENFPAIRMQGKSNQNGGYDLTSDQGTAKCAPLNGKLSCNVLLKNLVINPQDVKNFIMKKAVNEDEAAMRLEVADRFSGDPVGILTY